MILAKPQKGTQQPAGPKDKPGPKAKAKHKSKAKSGRKKAAATEEAQPAGAAPMADDPPESDAARAARGTRPINVRRSTTYWTENPEMNFEHHGTHGGDEEFGR